MRITSKGQVTIPQELRQKHGLLPLSEVDFVEKHGGLLLIKSKRPTRGKRIVETMTEGGPVKGSTRELLRMTRGD
jgi:AbrB family looped-hinge helix DNA binding protein